MVVADNDIDTGDIIVYDTDNDDESLVRYPIIRLYFSFCLMLSESGLSSLSLELACTLFNHMLVRTQMHLDSLPPLWIRRIG